MAKIETLSKEQLEKAMQCRNADELIELAKSGGIDLTKDEAEAYITDMSDIELDDAFLEKAAGGVCWTNCPGADNCGHHVCGTVGWEIFREC